MLPSRGRYWLAAALLLSLIFLTRSWWLPAVGLRLVETDPLQAADIAVVLAGDGDGFRVLEAARIARLGYAPRVLVNGSRPYYGANEAALAKAFAVRHGYPAGIFEPFPIKADSTIEEAAIVDRELRHRGVAEAIVVTSDFHTARSRWIFRQLLDSDIEYRLHSTPTRDFDAATWWQTRRGQKIVFIETLKTFHNWAESL